MKNKKLSPQAVVVLIIIFLLPSTIYYLSMRHEFKNNPYQLSDCSSDFFNKIETCKGDSWTDGFRIWGKGRAVLVGSGPTDMQECKKFKVYAGKTKYKGRSSIICTRNDPERWADTDCFGDLRGNCYHCLSVSEDGSRYYDNYVGLLKSCDYVRVIKTINVRRSQLKSIMP